MNFAATVLPAPDSPDMITHWFSLSESQLFKLTDFLIRLCRTLSFFQKVHLKRLIDIQELQRENIKSVPTAEWKQLGYFNFSDKKSLCAFIFCFLIYIFIITIIDNRPIVMFLYMLSAKAYTCGGFSYVACKIIFALCYQSVCWEFSHRALIHVHLLVGEVFHLLKRERVFYRHSIVNVVVQSREAPVDQYCSFLTLFKKPFDPQPPLALNIQVANLIDRLFRLRVNVEKIRRRSVKTMPHH